MPYPAGPSGKRDATAHTGSTAVRVASGQRFAAAPSRLLSHRVGTPPRNQVPSRDAWRSSAGRQHLPADGPSGRAIASRTSVRREVGTSRASRSANGWEERVDTCPPTRSASTRTTPGAGESIRSAQSKWLDNKMSVALAASDSFVTPGPCGADLGRQTAVGGIEAGLIGKSSRTPWLGQNVISDALVRAAVAQAKGSKSRATPLMQYRRHDGGGPSSKTCPRWLPHVAQ